MDPKGYLGGTDLLWSLRVLQEYFMNFLMWGDTLDAKFVTHPSSEYWLSFHWKSPASMTLGQALSSGRIGIQKNLRQI